MKKVITRIISFISFALVAIEAFNKISLYFVNKKTRVTPIVDKTYTWRFGDIKYMEKGKGTKSALEEIKDLYGFETAAIVSMADVVECLHNKPCNGEVLIDDAMKASIDTYYEQYGVK